MSLMLPSLATEPEVVEGRWCFGCGRRLVPKHGLVDGKLRAGVRVRWTEDICDNGPDGTCFLALAVMQPDHPALRRRSKKGVKEGPQPKRGRRRADA